MIRSFFLAALAAFSFVCVNTAQALDGGAILSNFGTETSISGLKNCLATWNDEVIHTSNTDDGMVITVTQPDERTVIELVSSRGGAKIISVGTSLDGSQVWPVDVSDWVDAVNVGCWEPADNSPLVEEEHSR